jgi:hypothetical protein
MDGNLTNLAYVACGVLIATYAWDRFNTPASNRSATRQALYWWSCVGYMLSALAVFAALSLLLRIGPWRTALLGSADNPSLPAPLIATLAMTTLLSSVPPLKQLDAWILSAFLNWAAIPAEVKRRAAAMTPQSFHVTDDDVTALREIYGDGSYGDTLAEHLRGRAAEGLELSRYRFTRVVKLYDRIKKMAGEPGYGRFFAESADELAALERKAAVFLRRSDASLTFAARLRTLDMPAAYEELAQERREAFAEGCRDIFTELALFLARAVLRSEASEEDIVRRLREVGFAASEPTNLPSFPIDSLTLLALGVFVYLAAVGIWFEHLQGVPHHAGGGLVGSCKIALARLVAVGVTLWLLQNYSVFRRAAGQPPRYFGYTVCGVVAGGVAAAVCLVFHLGDADLLGLRAEAPLILLTVVLCAAVALCCDDWAEGSVPPVWLRFVEAAGCASVMALGAALIYFAGLLPSSAGQMPGWMLAMWIGLPSFMALVIGGCVPHIYRSARHAALAQRGEVCDVPVRAPAVAPALLAAPTPPALAAGVN